MPIIKFSKGDLLRNQPITPGWYKGKIIKVKSETAEGKINGTITLDFEDQMLAADERTIDHTFWNYLGKGIGFMVPLMGAVLNKPIKEIADALDKGQTLDFNFDESLEGAKIQFRVENEIYQGNPQNRVKAFLPYSMEVPF